MKLKRISQEPRRAWGHAPGCAAGIRCVQRASERSGTAFSLLEVMIAMAIFFMAVFSILALVSNGLRNASLLLEMPVDAGMLAAELAETNRLEEGVDSGDFGDIFPDYKWVRQVTEVGSNGLYQVDFAVIRQVRGRQVESRMSILLYRPGAGQARPGMPRR
ncbi:MAG: hypothetical protein NZ739_08560 [Verrucomicrobiae bacterium]|nr:hypothetical protein [Verrucomicrobiae bacterium]